MKKLNQQSGSTPQDPQKTAEALALLIEYVSSPWRVMWLNFLAGIFRGLGALLGASILIALLFWVLSWFVDLPLIGEYASKLQNTVSGYISETNYNDEFERIGDTLERIEQRMKTEQRGDGDAPDVADPLQ